jgi:rare lipoprotein A
MGARMRMRVRTGLGLILAVCALTSCAQPRRSLDLEPPGEEIGIASYYAHKFHGRHTANGEIFDVDRLTAAHRTLPFGTRVRVTHLGNGREVILRINDRGPFVKGRIIDVSPRAARELGFHREGLARVRVRALRD